MTISDGTNSVSDGGRGKKRAPQPDRRKPLERRESPTSRMATAQFNVRHANLVRAKIKAVALLNRLQEFALSNMLAAKPDPRKYMTDAQIRAATALLAKVLPDLQRTELTGADGDPIEFSQRKAAEVAAAATPAAAHSAYMELVQSDGSPTTH